MQKMYIEARCNEYMARKYNNNIPYTADEIVEDALRCREAGASIFHYHARTPDGDPDNSLEINQEIISRIRAQCDILIHPTLGFTSNDADPNVRINRVAKLCEDPATRPDISPIDMGSFNFESWDAENKKFYKADMIYHNSTETILHAAETFRRLGVITQIVCWDIGFVRRASCLADMGIFREPFYFLFCTTGADIITGPLCTPVSVNALREALPQGRELTWCVDCCNGKLTGLIPWLAREGGHISLGLGDDPFLELGNNTTNADVIRMAAELARENGREIATPEETRKMLTQEQMNSHFQG